MKSSNYCMPSVCMVQRCSHSSPAWLCPIVACYHFLHLPALCVFHTGLAHKHCSAHLDPSSNHIFTASITCCCHCMSQLCTQVRFMTVLAVLPQTHPPPPPLLPYRWQAHPRSLALLLASIICACIQRALHQHPAPLYLLDVLYLSDVAL